MDVVTFKADRTEMDNVISFINGLLEKNGWDELFMPAIDIAAEEIFVNIASYAYSDDYTGERYARIECDVDENRAGFIFADAGMPYNPLEREDPDITLSAEERGIGGLGIYIVKQSMDEVSYSYENGENRFGFVKNKPDFDF